MRSVLVPTAKRKDCPIFFDFASLPQVDWEYPATLQPSVVPRSASEEQDFRKAMSHMYLLYAHEGTLVLRLNGEVPTPVYDIHKYKSNLVHYHWRGWCTFEHRVAEMKSNLALCVSYPLWSQGWGHIWDGDRFSNVGQCRVG